jgi:hypothetical protein
LIGEVTRDGVRAAVQTEALEHQANGALYLLVGIEAEARARGVPLVASRRAEEQLTTAGLVEPTAFQPHAHPVLLRLAHRFLETQQQSVVVVARRVHRLLVRDHHVGQAAQLQQPMPVRRGARQARDLERKDDSHASVRDVLR